jgi:hypothetical protein
MSDISNSRKKRNSEIVSSLVANSHNFFSHEVWLEAQRESKAWKAVMGSIGRLADETGSDLVKIDRDRIKRETGCGDETIKRVLLRMERDKFGVVVGCCKLVSFRRELADQSYSGSFYNLDDAVLRLMVGVWHVVLMTRPRRLLGHPIVTGDEKTHGCPYANDGDFVFDRYDMHIAAITSDMLLCGGAK